MSVKRTQLKNFFKKITLDQKNDGIRYKPAWILPDNPQTLKEKNNQRPILFAIMVLASLPFQIFLRVNVWLVPVYFLLQLGSMIYKGIFLPYPSQIYGGEIVFIVMYCLVDYLRLFFGTGAYLEAS
jgi:hypothetical protein